MPRSKPDEVAKFGKHWSVVNGSFAYGSEETFKNAMDRAPFNFYRLVRAIAIGDPFYLPTN